MCVHVFESYFMTPAVCVCVNRENVHLVSGEFLNGNDSKCSTNTF